MLVSVLFISNRGLSLLISYCTELNVIEEIYCYPLGFYRIQMGFSLLLLTNIPCHHFDFLPLIRIPPLEWDGMY